jgi:hypothetical protein
LSNVPSDEDYNLLLAAPATASPVASPADAVRPRSAALARSEPAAAGDDSPRLATNEPTSAVAAAGAAIEPSLAIPGGTPISGFSGGAMPTASNSAAAASAKAPTSDTGGTATPTATSTATTPATTTPVATTSPGSILDSPEALAARLAQYRSLMLNEAIQGNGMPANPAVVRRYLMVNRAAYLSQ